MECFLFIKVSSQKTWGKINQDEIIFSMPKFTSMIDHRSLVGVFLARGGFCKRHSPDTRLEPRSSPSALSSLWLEVQRSPAIFPTNSTTESVKLGTGPQVCSQRNCVAEKLSFFQGTEEIAGPNLICRLGWLCNPQNSENVLQWFRKLWFRIKWTSHVAVAMFGLVALIFPHPTSAMPSCWRLRLWSAPPFHSAWRFAKQPVGLTKKRIETGTSGGFVWCFYTQE